MKKLTVDSLLIYLLITFAASYAYADCIIQWWGDRSGAIPTVETSKTQQATLEVYNALFPLQGTWGGSCYGASYNYGVPGFFDYSGSYSACSDGTWGEYKIQYRDPVCFMGCSFGGEWEVICGVTTSTATSSTTTVPETLVTLIDFNAVPHNSSVTLVWSTASEINNAGFNLYRAESDNGEYIKINNSLIPAQGSSVQGTSYEFIDKDVKNRKTYYYKLEDIDLNGTSTFHETVSATPRLIYGIGK